LWRSQAHPGTHDFSRSEVDEFLSSHLAACNCPMPACNTIKTCRAALRHLLSMLDVVEPSSSGCSMVDAVVADFDRFMSDVCGLSHAT